MFQVLRQREMQHTQERTQLEQKIRTLENQLRILHLKANASSNSTSSKAASHHSSGGSKPFQPLQPEASPDNSQLTREHQNIRIAEDGKGGMGGSVNNLNIKGSNNKNGVVNNNDSLSYNNVILKSNDGKIISSNNNVHINSSLTNSLAVSQLQDLNSYFQERLLSSEVLKGFAYKTEYEMQAFSRFTLTRIYLVEPGLGKRVIEKPIGAKKKDLHEIVAYGVDQLNANRTQPGQNLYAYDDFVEGIFRTEPAAGTHYELYFRNKDSVAAGAAQDVMQASHVKLVVFRPYGPPLLAGSNVLPVREQWVNLILPLSGRVDTFRHFMERFVSVCVQQDRRVYLTVVYFGNEGLKEVKALMTAAARKHQYKHMKLITLNERFQRGRGLQIGALNWKSGDVLLFFCDVDVVFGVDFLERCRVNAERERRVYYPIVFSLYNPNIVYKLQDAPTPPLDEQLVISRGRHTVVSEHSKTHTSL
jgi:chondroitin sulfate N-acetylgalactosaminyltransferase 1/2